MSDQPTETAEPVEQPTDNWTLDFTKWDLHDVIEWDKSVPDIEKMIPLMEKAIVSTNTGIDLTVPDPIFKLNPYQWTALRKEFVTKMRATFQ